MADEKVKIYDGDLGDVIKYIEEMDESESLYDGDSAEQLQAIYDGEHVILSRADKTVLKDGKQTTVHTAKVALNYQEDIVESAIAFLLGKPVTINKDSDGGEDAFEFLTSALNDMHFHSRCKKLARKLFVQQRAAKLYFIKNPDGAKEDQKISSIVLSQENGEFFAIFDGTGDMEAFLRKYKVKRLVEGKAKEVELCELYTAEKIIYGESQNGKWVATTPMINPYGKIPVVYYEQDKPEWKSVQSIVDETELSYSKLIDTVDYFSRPKLTVAGRVTNLPDKGEVGEILQMEIIDTPGGGTVASEAKYLTWEERSESQKLMFDLAEKYIYQFSSSAALDFLNMIQSNIGELSGSALEVLMLKPIMKAYRKQELWGEMLKREISVVMAILGTMDAKYAKDFSTMKISLTFNSILPDNISSIIDDLVQAKQGGILSTETAVEYNPVVKNVTQEKDRLKAEKAVNPLDSIAGAN